MMVHMCSALVQEIFLVIFINKRAKREKKLVLIHKRGASFWSYP
jgi:hypothetical protein